MNDITHVTVNDVQNYDKQEIIWISENEEDKSSATSIQEVDKMPKIKSKKIRKKDKKLKKKIFKQVLEEIDK
jgi:hypothetical protein